MNKLTLAVLFPLFLLYQSSRTGAAVSTESGTITVVNIPDTYIEGIILVTGSAGTEMFTYSPKVLQRVLSDVMSVKVYEKSV
ncbi:MAG: hypothetical protein LBH75_00825 [Treponema sp.]|jgi:hypothetical protein|nr:hypothetical protein [Treponema sp.]